MLNLFGYCVAGGFSFIYESGAGSCVSGEVFNAPLVLILYLFIGLKNSYPGFANDEYFHISD
jgi:hypothetical protein